MPKPQINTTPERTQRRIHSFAMWCVLLGSTILVILALNKWWIPFFVSEEVTLIKPALTETKSIESTNPINMVETQPAVTNYPLQIENLMAAFQLQEAALRGHALHYPLEWLQLLLPQDPIVQKTIEGLTPYDQSGIPSIPILVEGLITMHEHIVVGVAIEPISKSTIRWLDRLKHWMHSQIRLRNIEQQQGTEVKLQCWHSAMKSMRENDLKHAVAAISACNIMTAEKEIWLAQAQKRLHAEEMIEQLVHYILGLTVQQSSQTQGGKGA